MTRTSLPALVDPRSKDASLQAALDRMLASHETSLVTSDDDPHVTAVRRLPAVEAAYAPFPEAMDPRLVRALKTRGIDQPYTHQAEAIGHALGGRNVVIVTPTASGKTLCYNAPVIDSILSDSSSRALYLFPTKALAQDQLAELQQLTEILAVGELRSDGSDGSWGSVGSGAPSIGVFTYDGDTPADARRSIRGRAHVVLSNPDMVHSGILPHHPRWAKLFENLKFVVIDELHAYRGVFGSHLGNILRRLRRICRHYGSSPTFICSSATIANPRELAEKLTGQPFELVEKSGAPRGEKFFLFVNPPVVNPQLGIRRSYLAETRRVAIEFLKRGLQCIVFAQSRLSTEILTTYLKDAFAGAPGSADVIRGYRGGYLPLRRREIERGLRQGDVRCVVSTNALELGIDIGALDVSVMAGYPGTIAATWQRAGRAGRRSGRSAAVLVTSSAPIDQFVARNPDYFFDASPEHALVNPDNLHILLDHVKCAAFELPFTTEETYGTADVQAVLGALADGGFVHQADGLWQWTQDSYPANAVSLRSISSDNFVVVDMTDGERVIGETDFTSGPSVLHEKAIYIVEGQLFQVERLDFDGRKAFVRAVECDYYTDAITHTKVTILEAFDNGNHEGPGVRGSGPRVPLISRRWRRGRSRPRPGEDAASIEAARDQMKNHARAAGRGRECGRVSGARRSARRLARRRVQEDSVLHERERRVRRAGSARAADAHDVVLAHAAGGRDEPAAVRRGGSAGRRDRARVRDAQRRAADADVRSARSRPVHRRHLRRRRLARRRRARDAAGGVGRADHLSLRQLSRRHRLQRAAVRHARRPRRAHA